MKVLAVGGGSGGHVTPIAAVLKELHRSDSSLEMRFVCDASFEYQSRGLMKQLDFDVPVSVIAAGKFRRYSHLSALQHLTIPSVVFRNIRDISRIIHGFFQSVGLLVRWRPDVVFAKGGYVCLPVGIASWLLRIPLVIHDSDTRPGLTNKVLSRFATKIATGFPLENYPYDGRISRYTGVPIGAEFAPADRSEQSTLKAKLGFDKDLPLVVAVGGGLGSDLINTVTIRAMDAIRSDASAYIITGRAHYKKAASRVSNSKKSKIVPFVYEGMSDILRAADVVVTRGSATFLQELAGIGKPVVVIPAHQLGDQIKNAELYKKEQAAVVLSDKKAGEGALADALDQLLENPSERTRLSKSLHAFARPEAASNVAKLIMDTLTGR